MNHCLECDVPVPEDTHMCETCREADRGTYVHGFTKGELSDAFNAIAPPDDWRGRISAVIPPRVFDISAVAVEFYTATRLEIVGVVAPNMIEVCAVGYREGPAGG